MGNMNNNSSNQQQSKAGSGMCLEVIIQEEEADNFPFVQRRKMKSQKPLISAAHVSALRQTLRQLQPKLPAVKKAKFHRVQN